MTNTDEKVNEIKGVVTYVRAFKAQSICLFTCTVFLSMCTCALADGVPTDALANVPNDANFLLARHRMMLLNFGIESYAKERGYYPEVLKDMLFEISSTSGYSADICKDPTTSETGHLFTYESDGTSYSLRASCEENPEWSSWLSYCAARGLPDGARLRKEEKADLARRQKRIKVWMVPRLTSCTEVRECYCRDFGFSEQELETTVTALHDVAELLDACYEKSQDPFIVTREFARADLLLCHIIENGDAGLLQAFISAVPSATPTWVLRFLEKHMKCLVASDFCSRFGVAKEVQVQLIADTVVGASRWFSERSPRVVLSRMNRRQSLQAMTLFGYMALVTSDILLDAAQIGVVTESETTGILKAAIDQANDAHEQAFLVWILYRVDGPTAMQYFPTLVSTATDWATTTSETMEQYPEVVRSAASMLRLVADEVESFGRLHDYYPESLQEALQGRPLSTTATLVMGDDGQIRGRFDTMVDTSKYFYSSNGGEFYLEALVPGFEEFSDVLRCRNREFRSAHKAERARSKSMK